jgi:hypothetical protein
MEKGKHSIWINHGGTLMVMSNFVVRPIKGAVIGSGFLLGYEGQARLPGPAGVDHALRVAPVVSRLRAHLHKVTPRPVRSIVFSLRRHVSHGVSLDLPMPCAYLGLSVARQKII